MTVLALDLQQLSERIPESDSDAREQLLSFYDDMTTLGHDVNSISHRLHSSKLGLLGLALRPVRSGRRLRRITM
jgi:hypothetical protein